MQKFSFHPSTQLTWRLISFLSPDPHSPGPVCLPSPGRPQARQAMAAHCVGASSRAHFPMSELKTYAYAPNSLGPRRPTGRGGGCRGRGAVFKSGNCKSSSMLSQRLGVENFRLHAGFQRRRKGARGPRCLSWASQAWPSPTGRR